MQRYGNQSRESGVVAYDIDAGWSWQDPNVTAVPLGGLTAALVVPTG